MKVLQVSTSDIGGGAEKIAFDLHNSYSALGISSFLLVKNKNSDKPTVIEIPPTNWFQFWQTVDKHFLASNQNGAYFIHQLIRVIRSPHSGYSRITGKENFHFPESRRMVRNYGKTADIIHMHNLHNQYFDIRQLPYLSRKVPVILTLHDEYLYTGHCACTFNCERWQTGCGKCPYLKTYPSIQRDGTHYNWKRKKRLFSKAELTIVTPSCWLADRVRLSLLAHLHTRIIPNGIDLEVFKPGDKEAARNAIGLNEESIVILYVANRGRKNQFKDYEMLERVIVRLENCQFSKTITLLSVGHQHADEKFINDIHIVERPTIKDSKELARYYQSCDLYLHPSKADNAPLAILEAMACGKTVIATNVGGIPELVQEGITGYTVQLGDDEAMAEIIISLLNEPNKLKQLGENAAEIAKHRYGLQLMVNNYLNLYQELIENWAVKKIK